MKKYYFNRSYSVSRQDFNSERVLSVLDKFENVIENGKLVTTYDGRSICSVEVSKVYYNFDFSSFSKSILGEIVNYFSPEKYSLRVASGCQEIRLFGDEIWIDNERYEKMISIVNSTDKSRALSMNVGLVRCEKGYYPRFYIVLTSFTNKHYKSSLPEKIKSFSDNLINFNMDVNFHIKTIEDLKNKNVSLVEFAKAMSYDEDGKFLKSIPLKLNALGKRLWWNKSIRNNLNLLKSENFDKLTDAKVNAKILFNLYVELFKEQDTSVISRESRRVLESLDKVNNVE